MPVDAVRTTQCRTADLQQQCRRELRILLVVLVVLDDTELVTDVLGRPMALLAGLARRAQVVQWCRHRPRIQVKGYGNELPGAADLGFYEPVRAGTDMAFGARDALVR